MASTDNPPVIITPADPDQTSRPTTPTNKNTEGAVPDVHGMPMTTFKAASLHTSEHYTRDERVTAMAHEISGRIVGPVAEATFVTTFLPTKPKATPLSPVVKSKLRKDLSKLSELKSEVDMYEPWIKAIASICPNMTVVDTHNHGAPDFENKTVKPDVCLYDEKKYKQQEDGVHNIKKVEMMVEFKLSEDDDPFQDSGSSFTLDFERTSRAASDTLGQISLYATAHQAVQYRTHVFSALVFRNYMRLLYWDRSGLVVTEKIQWDSVVLPSFFFRLNHATDEERGIDTTINTNPILKYGFQTTVLKALGRSAKNDRDSLLEISINHNKYLAYEPEIYARTSSPIGRATRTFGQVYCVSDGKIVFLKDTWRIVRANLQPEHEVYKKLMDKGVTGIPQLIDAGDIANQCTRIRAFYNSQKDRCTSKPGEKIEEVSQAPRELQHYRLALESLEGALESVPTAKEMISVVQNCAETHRQAAIDALILHRDISTNNMMTKRVNGVLKGFLIDWDLSKDLSIEVTADDEVQHERAGTWQFLAIRLLKYGKKQPAPNRVDDVESFSHVLAWMALRYAKHSLPTPQLSNIIYQNFESSYTDRGTGRTYISDVKEMYLTSSTWLVNANFSNAGILAVLKFVTSVVSQRYTVIMDELKPSQSTSPVLDPEMEEMEASLSAAAIEYRKRGLARLESDRWLPDILRKLLDSPDIDWDTNGELKENEITDPRLAPHTHKRKSDSDFLSVRATKVTRQTGQMGVHDRDNSAKDDL